MRMTLISMLVVLMLVAAVCTFSMRFILNVSAQMEDMHNEVMDCAEAGNTEEAKERLSQMAQYWKKSENIMAALVPHGSIHEITGLLIESNACLKAEDMDDFMGSMALLGEALQHLEEDERFHLSNIL